MPWSRWFQIFHKYHFIESLSQVLWAPTTINITVTIILPSLSALWQVPDIFPLFLIIVDLGIVDVFRGIIIIIIIRRCLWCNGYRCRKWTQRCEFKSWTRMIAFHIALIPLGKVWFQFFSHQLWVNSWTDCVLQPWWGN